MPDRRRQRRVWATSLLRFELRLRTSVGLERNVFARESALSYASNGGSVPGWVQVQHRKRLESILRNHYTVVVQHFGKIALDQIKSRHVEVKSYFQNFMAEWVATQSLIKAKMISDTDMDDVRDAIALGLAEGEGVAAISQRIREITELSAHRAATVARTETHAAATFGSLESVRQAQEDIGVVMMKEWLPTLDDRTRPEHREMDNYGPIELSEKFDVGGEMLDRPGDPSGSPENIINCRCALIYEEKTS